MNESILKTPEKAPHPDMCAEHEYILSHVEFEDTVLSSSVVLSPARPGNAPLPPLPPAVGISPSVPSAPSVLHVGCRKNNFLDVHSSSVHAAKLSGMKQSQIAYKAKAYFDNDAKTEKMFGYTTVNIGDKERSIPRRLYFYCTERKDGCLFCIPWTWDRDAYVLLESVTVNQVRYDFNLSHTHSTNELQIDGYTLVKHMKDLTTEEREFISNGAFTPQSIPAVKIALNKKFFGQKRDFCEDLIRRVRDNVLSEYYGDDRHQIALTRKDGLEILLGGGVWKEDIDDQLRLSGTYRQTKLQRHFTQEYGAYYATCDGTHGMNRYSLTAVIPVIVDALGLSIISGLATMRAENTVDIVQMCELFDLSNFPAQYSENVMDGVEDVIIENAHLKNSHRGTLATDEGSWTDKTAKAIGKDHQLCVYHKSANIMVNRRPWTGICERNQCIVV